MGPHIGNEASMICYSSAVIRRNHHSLGGKHVLTLIVSVQYLVL